TCFLPPVKSPAKYTQIVHRVLALASIALALSTLFISCGKKQRSAKARAQQPQIANHKSRPTSPKSTAAALVEGACRACKRTGQGGLRHCRSRCQSIRHRGSP